MHSSIYRSKNYFSIELYLFERYTIINLYNSFLILVRYENNEVVKSYKEWKNGNGSLFQLPANDFATERKLWIIHNGKLCN